VFTGSGFVAVHRTRRSADRVFAIVLKIDLGCGGDGFRLRPSFDMSRAALRLPLQRVCWFGLFLFALASITSCLAAPFARQFSFTQPDGIQIQLWGRGDEFHAEFETLDGYTVLFVPEDQAYYYARRSADGNSLESSGIPVGAGALPALPLEPHVRIAPAAAHRTIQANRQAWDQQARLSERWSKLKAQNSLDHRAAPLGPPVRPTLGAKCGLTLLVDFEDEPATIPQEEIFNFLNGEGYTGYGNNGSVKQYFWDVSNGKLLFTNVVTAYVRIPNSIHPRSYYNDVSRSAGERGARLVYDALQLLKDQPQFTNEIVPKLSFLTLDSRRTAVSFNVFVAGDSSGAWSYGIWGHQGSLFLTGAQALWPGGPSVNIYQLSPIGQKLELHTFCHENGHMLCDFPDLYDYNYDAYGGAGCFCLMGYGTTDNNPPQVCAYLKLAAGWATAVDFEPDSSLLASLSASGLDFNRFYRWKNPLQHTEYFLIENRLRTGHDADLPGSGVAIWHIDELGDRDNQSLQPNSVHANYEATLVAADNQWDFAYLINEGDATDLFYPDNPAPGYLNAFSDFTAPSALWWDGTSSGLDLAGFSDPGPTITFQARVRRVVFSREPVDLTVFEGQPASLVFRLAEPAPLNARIQWRKDGQALEATDRVSGVDTSNLMIHEAQPGDAGFYGAVYEYAAGLATSRVAQLTVRAGRPWFSTNLNCSGSATVLPDGFDLRSSGAGIRSSADAFSWIYQPVHGDFDIRARLYGLNVKTEATRAGITVRTGLSPTNRHLSLLYGITYPTRPCSVVTRLTEGGMTTELLAVPSAFEQAAPLADYWMRIKREGPVFTFYQSTNGWQWVFLKSATLELETSVWVGLVAASTLEATTAAFRSCQLLSDTPSTLAIFPNDNKAQEGALNTAQATVLASRNGPWETHVSWSGSGSWGLDYAPVSGRITVPAGTNAGLITLSPINDAEAERPETVTMSLEETSGFNLVEPSSATVLILDDDQTDGGLVREFYSSLGGSTVNFLAQQMANLTARQSVGWVTSFETPQNAGDNYGQVLSGFLIPPVSGDYRLFLASDDNSELWLSPDEEPSHARLVAQVKGTARYRHYLGSGNSSDPIHLEQDHYYYVKALHKERIGEDCLSVAWQRPNEPLPADLSDPIQSSCLAYSLPINQWLKLDPPATRFAAESAVGLVRVSTKESWTAWSPDPWISVLDASVEADGGSVLYAVQANHGPGRRVGTLVVNGRTHSVVQHSIPKLQISSQPNRASRLCVTDAEGYTLILETSEDLRLWRPVYTNKVMLDLDLKILAPSETHWPVQFYRVLAQ
jgi:M6 family metalloprotease-like protein